MNRLSHHGEFEIIAYCDEKNLEPFSQWFGELDFKIQNIVFARLNRIKLGNFGDCESVGDKVYEIKIHIGPGYRIYFAKERNKLILLLCAGDKSSQKKDIKKAKNFLQRFYEKQN